jgi:PPK2 family polyphosphate:nucleotide phosphotransferase
VTSFKQPSPEEIDHDFLWRSTKALPERGRIGVFNRSYYEETLIVRVHPELLERQRMPPSLIGRRVWKDRFRSIADYERHLAVNGTVIRKFFLHISKAEQRRRFLERLDDPRKNWKFNVGDVAERQHWDAYQKAFEETISATSFDHAPWYVAPADKKWFAHLLIAHVIIETLEGLELTPPEVTEAHHRQFGEARKLLMRERG